jgi:hypothetical protein
METQNRIEAQTLDIEAYVKAFAITSDEGLEEGKNQIRLIKDLKDEVESTFGPIKRKTNDAHKEAVAQEKRHLEPLVAAERAIKGVMGKYMDDVEEKQRKEEALRAEEARKEKDKLIAKAGKRIDKLMEKTTDKRAQVDLLKHELEDPELEEAEENVLRAKIETLETQIDSHVEAVEEKRVEVEEVHTAPVVAAPTVKSPKIDGLSSVVKKKAEVINPMQLVKAVAEGGIPIGVIKFDLKVIEKLLAAGVTKIPGVQFREERIVRTR